MYGDNYVNLHFLENFQKSSDGPSKPSGDSYHFNCISRFEGKPPGGTNETVRRRLLFNPIMGSLMKGLAVVGDLPGDASHLGLIFMFS